MAVGRGGVVGSTFPVGTPVHHYINTPALCQKDSRMSKQPPEKLENSLQFINNFDASGEILPMMSTSVMSTVNMKIRATTVATRE